MGTMEIPQAPVSSAVEKAKLSSPATTLEVQKDENKEEDVSDSELFPDDESDEKNHESMPESPQASREVVQEESESDSELFPKDEVDEKDHESIPDSSHATGKAAQEESGSDSEGYASDENVSIDSRQDSSNFPDQENINVCFAGRLDHQVIRKLPHWSYLIMPDIQQPSSWKLPVRGPDGRINLPLLREARLQLQTGKRNGFKVLFKVDKVIEKNAEELCRIAWPGLPELNVSDSIMTSTVVEKPRFWPGKKTNWKSETDKVLENIGLKALTPTKPEQKPDTRKQEKVKSYPRVDETKTAMSLVEKLKHNLQASKSNSQNMEMNTQPQAVSDNESFTMDSDGEDDEDMEIILDDTDSDSEDEDTTQEQEAKATCSPEKPKSRKALRSNLYQQAKEEVAIARARELGFKSVEEMEAKRRVDLQRLTEARKKQVEILKLRQQRAQEQMILAEEEEYDAPDSKESEDEISFSDDEVRSSKGTTNEKPKISDGNPDQKVDQKVDCCRASSDLKDSSVPESSVCSKMQEPESISKENESATADKVASPTQALVSHIESLVGHETESTHVPEQQQTATVGDTHLMADDESAKSTNEPPTEKVIPRTFSRKSKKTTRDAEKQSKFSINPFTRVLEQMESPSKEKEPCALTGDKEQSSIEPVAGGTPSTDCTPSEEAGGVTEKVVDMESPSTPSTAQQAKLVEDTSSAEASVNHQNDSETNTSTTDTTKESAEGNAVTEKTAVGHAPDSRNDMQGEQEDDVEECLADDEMEEIEENDLNETGKEEDTKAAQSMKKAKKMRPPGNNIYRAILEKESEQAKKLKQSKASTFLDNEASEEEEDEAIGNYGDKSLMDNFLVRKKKDEVEERLHADKIRKGDLDAIVDTYSDDEGDDGEALEAHQQFMRERDEKLEKALQRGVETHNFNLLKGKGVSSRVEKELGHESDFEEDDEEEELAKKERRQILEAEARKRAILKGEVTGVTVEQVDEELERTKEFQSENRFLLAQRLKSSNSQTNKVSSSYRRPLADDDDSRLIRGMLKRSVSMTSSIGEMSNGPLYQQSDMCQQESRDSLFLSNASRSNHAFKKRKSFIPFLQSSNLGDETMDDNSRSMTGESSQLKSINRSFVYSTISSNTTPIDVDGDAARMGTEVEMPKRKASKNPRYAPLSQKPNQGGTAFSSIPKVSAGLSALLVQRRSTNQKRKRR